MQKQPYEDLVSQTFYSGKKIKHIYQSPESKRKRPIFDASQLTPIVFISKDPKKNADYFLDSGMEEKDVDSFEM